jgi:hypothetical protein
MDFESSPPASKDSGSMALFGIGLAALSLVTVLIVLASGSVYLTERRLTTVSEATALSVLTKARGDLNQDLGKLARDFLSINPLTGLHNVSLVEVMSSEGKTVRVRLCSSWNPIFVNYMFSEVGKICSEGLARRGR